MSQNEAVFLYTAEHVLRMEIGRKMGLKTLPKTPTVFLLMFKNNLWSLRRDNQTCGATCIGNLQCDSFKDTVPFSSALTCGAFLRFMFRRSDETTLQSVVPGLISIFMVLCFMIRSLFAKEIKRKSDTIHRWLSPPSKSLKATPLHHG